MFLQRPLQPCNGFLHPILNIMKMTQIVIVTFFKKSNSRPNEITPLMLHYVWMDKPNANRLLSRSGSLHSLITLMWPKSNRLLCRVWIASNHRNKSIIQQVITWNQFLFFIFFGFSSLWCLRIMGVYITSMWVIIFIIIPSDV